MKRTKNETTGHDLYAEYEDVVARIHEDAVARNSVVQARLAALEAEANVIGNLVAKVGA